MEILSFDANFNYYDYLCECCRKTFETSQFNEIVSVNLNKDKSVSFCFCGQKAFDVDKMIKKQAFAMCVKNDLFKLLTDIPVSHTIDNIKSLSYYTRILVNDSYSLKSLIDYIFSLLEDYVDSHYISDSAFDCCHRYMECSDAHRCTCPDRLYAKGCTYKAKLEKGIIFFGKNRNVD